MKSVDFEEVKKEVFEDRIKKFFYKNKIIIISFLVLLLFLPVLFQLYLFYQNKRNEKLFSEYLKAEILLKTNQKDAINILNKLVKTGNQTIVLLSFNRLLDHYLDTDINEAMSLIKKDNLDIDKNYLNELINIKKVMISFDKIDENQINKLIKSNNKDVFKLIKNKLIYDYYIKNNQINKAEQFNNINK